PGPAARAPGGAAVGEPRPRSRDRSGRSPPGGRWPGTGPGFPDPLPAAAPGSSGSPSTSLLSSEQAAVGEQRACLRSGQPGPAGVLERLPPGDVGGVVGLAQVFGGRTDPVGYRLQLLEVEAVEVDLVEPEDAGRLLDRDVGKSLLQERPRIRPGPLGM